MVERLSGGICMCWRLGKPIKTRDAEGHHYGCTYLSHAASGSRSGCDQHVYQIPVPMYTGKACGVCGVTAAEQHSSTTSNTNISATPSVFSSTSRFHTAGNG